MTRSFFILAVFAVACGAHQDSDRVDRPDWSDVQTEVFDPECDPPPCSYAFVELKEQSKGQWVKVVCCNPYRDRLSPIAPG